MMKPGWMLGHPGTLRKAPLSAKTLDMKRTADWEQKSHFNATINGELTKTFNHSRNGCKQGQSFPWGFLSKTTNLADSRDPPFWQEASVGNYVNINLTLLF